jgi:hypothetical protein
LNLYGFKGGKVEVGEVFPAQFCPKAFDGVEVRAVWWQKNESDCVRNLQFFGSVPSRAVHDHENSVTGEYFDRFSEKTRHRFGVGFFFYRGYQTTIPRGDGAKKVDGFADELLFAGWTNVAWCPAAINFADSAKSGLILKEKA